MQSFLSIQGKAFPSLQPRPRPYNHAHSYEWAFSIYPAQPGLPLPFLAGAQTPHPQRPGLARPPAQNRRPLLYQQWPSVYISCLLNPLHLVREFFGKLLNGPNCDQRKVDALQNIEMPIVRNDVFCHSADGTINELVVVWILRNQVETPSRSCSHKVWAIG